LGIGDWGLGNPQSPIPNPQKAKIKEYRNYRNNIIVKVNNINVNVNN